MAFNDQPDCLHQASSNLCCFNCGAILSSKFFALKHPKYCYKPELNPRKLFEKMCESNCNDISLSQLNKKYIEKRRDIIRVLHLINTRLNFASQTFFLSTCYLDEVVFKCDTMTKTSEFLLIGLSCLLVAAKFNENDPNVPEMKKFIVVCCELIKYRYRYRLEDLRIGEIFVLKQLDYKMNYYSIYHFIVFFFAHGIITEKMLSKHNEDLTASTSQSVVSKKRVIKVLEQIYVQAREIMEVLLESEEHCVFGRDNHIAAAVIMKIAIENSLAITAIPQEDDLLYLGYGIDERLDDKYEEVRRKVKSACEQKYSNKTKADKEMFEPNAGLLRSSGQNSHIKEKKTFDSSTHKTLHLHDYESQNLLTNNPISSANSKTSKARESQDNYIKDRLYEGPRRESSNIESVRDELFTITSKIRKRACSSNKDKNKEPQKVQSNNFLIINQEGLPSKYQSTNQVFVDNNIQPYNNYNQQQPIQLQNDLLDKTKYLFGQTRNPKKQIILYSGSVNPKPIDSHPPGYLYQTGIDTYENQSPSTIIINNNININIQDKHLSSSQLLKKGDEQLHVNDLRRSNHYPSRMNNNFGTYYNYNRGNGVNANQFNYYVMNPNRYDSCNMNISGNRYGSLNNN